MTPDEIERYAYAAADRALSKPCTQADADAFERLLHRMDDSELRGFMMACELHMMQRLANAQSKPDPIAL